MELFLCVVFVWLFMIKIKVFKIKFLFVWFIEEEYVVLEVVVKYKFKSVFVCDCVLCEVNYKLCWCKDIYIFSK